MKQGKKKLGLLGIFLFIICILLVILFFLHEEQTYINYKEFIQDIELGQVEEVEIQADKIVFQKENDETIYYTDNPETNDFKEYLLLQGVSIQKTYGEEEIVYVLDWLFYGVFFAAMIFGIYKLISFQQKNFKVIRKNKTKFSDIAGMQELKKDMMKTVDVLKNPEMYRDKGIRAPKGIILEGPPGNGKTLFARALAGEANMNFIATKGADFQSAMMSIGPRKIKSLFRKARKNKPCIIFIDEFDGIGERRNYAGTGIDKENNRMITAMLNEMDGFTNEDGVLVIAATNSYASLDAALVRPGRFDMKYNISNPDEKTILELIEMYTKKKKLDTKIQKEQLAKCFEKLSCSAIETVLNEAAMEAEMNGTEEISITDIANAGRKTNTVNIKIK